MSSGKSVDFTPREALEAVTVLALPRTEVDSTVVRDDFTLHPPLAGSDFDANVMPLSQPVAGAEAPVEAEALEVQRARRRMSAGQVVGKVVVPLAAVTGEVVLLTQAEKFVNTPVGGVTAVAVVLAGIGSYLKADFGSDLKDLWDTLLKPGAGRSSGKV